MKKILFFCIFITGVMNINAQIECGTIMEDDGIAMEVDQNVTMESFLGLEPYVVKVHFWDINDTDGTNPHPLSEETALNAVAQLNKNYNAFNIFFKYDGKDVFDSEYFDTNLDPDESEDVYHISNYMYTNGYFLQGVVNVYSLNEILVDGPGGGSPVEAAGLLKGGNEFFKMILMRHDYIEPTNHNISALTHEVGHFFKLKHTFHCSVSTSDEVTCENVTRDVTDTDCYNADTEGDEIIDTNATFYPMEYDTNSCLYIPNGELDSCGIPYYYEGLEPEVKNFMGYSGTCKEEFTPGQVAVMRARIFFIINHPDIHYIETYPVSFLYEPYKGEYYLAGPSTSHNPPLLQYGFDYVFYDTSQADVYNQPSAYNDTSFWYGDVVQSYDIEHNTPIVHPNHTAFKILQIDVNYPRMCYNNYNKAPSDGTIIKFLDGVPNTNVTITEQDSSQINSTNFIENLEPGLYNIIENYEDGGSQETMIFKENN